ncbi:MAG: tryptophan-rich sensory protein [Deltaproteobacteria bacterium]|nr:MAG: tryptophan-rich sensory protein [Deltaproteobacteria bacterium]
MILRLIVFLVLNFSALLLGGLFTGAGVPSNWYQELNKAPWTPPGWVFGAAWTLIMICFAVYMAKAWDLVPDRRLLIGMYVVQWVLNVSWNPLFFKFHWTGWALLDIMALTVVVGWFLFAWRQEMKSWALLSVPYFLWLLIATSLNAWAFFKN